MKRYFHSELEEIRSNLVLMGQRSVDNLRASVRALVENDMELAEKVLTEDDAIDELDIFIDRESVRYITLRSPVASDVRLLTVAMKCSHDLERCGDEASSIAKRARRISENGTIQDFGNIPRMAELSITLLRDSLASFIEEDLERARQLPPRDKEIDQLNRQTFQELNELIMEDKEVSSSATQLMFISKSLERIGDHACNIAEEVCFLLSGQDIRYQSHTNEA